MAWPGAPSSQQSPPINPPSVRFPSTLNENSTMADVAEAVRTVVNGVTVHEQAFAALPAQIAAQTKTAVTQAVTEFVSNETVTGVTAFNSQTGAIIYFPGLGTVNDQLGVSSYVTQPSDNGAKIIVGDSGAVAVTLNNTVPAPWFTIIDNDSSGVATLLPDSGALLHGPSQIQGSGFGIVFFDGSNFWADASGAGSGGGSSAIRTVGITIDGGGNTPSTGIKGFVTIPYACTITSWTCIADQTGSASVDICYIVGSGAPPAAPNIPTDPANLISASAPVLLSFAQSAAGGASAISTWSTSLAQWGTLMFNLNSVTTCTRITVQLQVKLS